MSPRAAGRLARLPGPRAVRASCCPEVVALDEWGYPIVEGEVTAGAAPGGARGGPDVPPLALRLV